MAMSAKQRYRGFRTSAFSSEEWFPLLQLHVKALSGIEQIYIAEENTVAPLKKMLKQP